MQEKVLRKTNNYIDKNLRKICEICGKFLFCFSPNLQIFRNINVEGH